MQNASRLAAATILLLVGALSPTAAQADAARTITVTGEGEVRGVPDQAQLSAGVTTVAVTANAALAENARKMTSVFAALSRIGVPQREMKTSNFSVSPQYPPYNQNNAGPQKIVGYQVSNQVDVTLDDVKTLGPALDALVAAGANQINAISFSIRDPQPLLAAAREQAVADAIGRAQTYAKAAGVTLGPILTIQEGGADVPRPVFFAAKVMAGAPPPTPTAAGEQSVTANVSIVFEIK
jgi:uncharacterized protein YggE